MSNIEFRRHVTSTAFSMSLSRSMIEMLVWTAVAGDRTGTPLRNWHTTVGALRERGLLGDSDDPKKHVKSGYLTRAGELTVELLKESGQYQEVYERYWPEGYRAS